MCGILGVWSRGGRPSPLREPLARLAHRGPDDRGEYVSARGDLRMGSVRLAILDLSPLGHQPMAAADGAAVLAYNGELYNFRELRAELEAEGHRFRGRSDTEVLLALYQRHGEAMLPRLNGIFAFAIHDAAKDLLLLARDAHGVKPLYFSEDERGFAFASELKALLPLAGGRGTLDLAALFRYLGYLWCPGTGTPLREVQRVAPGAALTVRDGRITRRWHWAPSTWTGEPIRVDDAGASELVAGGLRTAVRRQLVADVPVGAFLSGGLDSSAIVALARAELPRIQCFTIVNDRAQADGFADDLPYARRVARHLDVPLHEVRVQPNDVGGDLERMVYQLDEPLADPAPLNVLYISQLAAARGIKVLLSGAGGDDLFTGYRRHRALLAERWWAWLPAPARAALARAAASAGQGHAFGRRLGKAFAHAGALADARLTGYFLWSDPARLRGLFAPEHRAALAAESIDAPMREFLEALPAGLPRLHRLLALEQRFFLADHNLAYTDKMSMATGVEVRVPFLDDDLVRLANRLPPRVKQRGGTGKWVLKKAMEPYLPADVIHRPKTGFGAPLRRWLRHDLREMVGDVLSARSLRGRGLFDPAAVAQLQDDDRRGRIDAAYTILGLVCVELWCRQFLDGGAVAASRPFARTHVG